MQAPFRWRMAWAGDGSAQPGFWIEAIDVALQDLTPRIMTPRIRF